MLAIRIQARYIVASPDQIIPCGQIVLRRGKIVEVASRTADQADIDMGNAVLLPGLVNPHTHLEFSDLTRPFPAGKCFPDWIRSLVEFRRNRQSQLNTVDLAQQFDRAIESGLSESDHYGVAALCDIVTPPWNIQSLPTAFPSKNLVAECYTTEVSAQFRATITQADLLEHFSTWAQCPSVIACMEQIGLDEERISASRKWAQETESTASRVKSERLISLGYSPHAPYSTQWPFVCETIEKAQSSGKLVAMHLAESREEREWLEQGTGAFPDAFERLGIRVQSNAKPSLCDVIEQLGRPPRSLLIHGNYLTQHEIEAAAKHRDRLSIVYCPRTHAHFQHGEYPLQALQQAGLRVVFGTDSRASNPDLNLWQEARLAASKHSELSPSDAFGAITCNAARSLGIANRFGSISAGMEASLNVVPELSPAIREKELLAWLLACNDRVMPLHTALLTVISEKC